MCMFIHAFNVNLHTPLCLSPVCSENMLVYTSVHLPLLWVVIMAWMGLRSQSTGTTNSRRQRWHDVHGAVCGLLTAIGLSEGATVLLKLYIQRRRPNFYALCGWSNELLRCTAPLVKLREANFSFPSGHSSLTSCAMTFLAWFLLSKVVAARGPRWLALSSCVLPGAWAAFVGASRLVDHWHHPSDVVAGLLLGGICSTAAFHTWYPPVWLSVSSSSSGQYVVGLPWSLQTTEVAKLPSFSD
jgi:membrane-associated phospholipid phosphatase